MRHLYRSYRVFCAQNQARLFNPSKRFNSTVSTTEKIVIPKRIQRSSTDILYALSSTVGNDPTASLYKYHDDPFLIPQSNIGKRTFALSQEAGRYSNSLTNLISKKLKCVFCSGKPQSGSDRSTVVCFRYE